MNTNLWGPPAWKLLHSLSFAVDPSNDTHVRAASRLLQLMPYVLPCKYCRSSCHDFIEEQVRATGTSVADVTRNGKLPEWMYNLHCLVSGKLDKHHAKEHAATIRDALHKCDGDGAAASALEALCKSRAPTLECVRKRYRMRPVSFCADDVFTFLFCVAMNTPDDSVYDEEKAKRVDATVELVRAMAAAVEVCTPESALASALRAAHRAVTSGWKQAHGSASHHGAKIPESWVKMAADVRAERAEPSMNWMVRVYTLAWLLAKDPRTWHAHSSANSAAASLVQRFGIARAGTCSSGKCT